ncbi:hypothetical protein VOLCADRAFT_90397 [Volvox carteri f. nagariensis]|uniref:Dirigent protein n=1 Tax=Volvox carteri f. nagariensis TaxID=3068 RepID=D8TU95_VOLCA|nr:uncharacterized protein VOLCADRAFT_90397 [Volvox carteri f. nagariensis]EFJ48998.1 hypothetical protein VOLCADRAFT_90397 [Volvox carteri f. nagariensis]|eukprot:XP_002949895.1 hypothetical protein VOLCADRAFT_90397 [Volvox carteri f. nagariensis]
MYTYSGLRARDNARKHSTWMALATPIKYLHVAMLIDDDIGMVSAFCYQFDLRYSYCVNTLEIGIFGTITFLGPFTDVQDAYFENAVTGGTGIYRGAEGVVKVKVLKQGEVYAYKIVLEDEPKCYDK